MKLFVVIPWKSNTETYLYFLRSFEMHEIHNLLANSDWTDY